MTSFSKQILTWKLVDDYWSNPIKHSYYRRFEVLKDQSLWLNWSFTFFFLTHLGVLRLIIRASNFKIKTISGEFKEIWSEFLGFMKIQSEIFYCQSHFQTCFPNVLWFHSLKTDHLIIIMSIKVLFKDVCVFFRNMFCVWRAYLEGTVQATQFRVSACENYKVQVADPAKTARLQKEQQLRKVLLLLFPLNSVTSVLQTVFTSLLLQSEGCVFILCRS